MKAKWNGVNFIPRKYCGSAELVKVTTKLQNKMGFVQSNEFNALYFSNVSAFRCFYTVELG